jgi:hypothetical protein
MIGHGGHEKEHKGRLKNEKHLEMHQMWLYPGDRCTARDLSVM